MPRPPWMVRASTLPPDTVPQSYVPSLPSQPPEEATSTRESKFLKKPAVPCSLWMVS